MGCNNNVFLIGDLVQCSQQHNIYNLAQEMEEYKMIIWEKGWMTTKNLGISGALVGQQILYTIELHNGNIPLKVEPSSLIWSQNTVGGPTRLSWIMRC